MGPPVTGAAATVRRAESLFPTGEPQDHLFRHPATLGRAQRRGVLNTPQKSAEILRQLPEPGLLIHSERRDPGEQECSYKDSSARFIIPSLGQRERCASFVVQPGVYPIPTPFPFTSIQNTSWRQEYSNPDCQGK